MSLYDNRLSIYFVIQTLKSKQSGLLSQLDEIDEESSRLREELVEMEITHSSTVMELKEMQAHYKHIQEQFHIEQVRLGPFHCLLMFSSLCVTE